ncbi:MAG: cell division protein CrgA [Micromonosporaceae bacterium]|nr:cell division protein CrgA [Micromonosporaceae bacterium]
MPKSQVRKKKVYTPPAELQPKTAASSRKPSPVWVPALAVTLIFAGILWLVVYYLTQGFADIEAFSVLAEIQYWNLAIGFGALVASLLLLSKWR